MKKINKALAVVLSLMMILATVPVISVSAKDVTTEYIPSSPYDVMPADVSTEPANNKGDDEIPSSFDARDSIDIPAIRNQNPYGDCWAHASTAAVEVSLIKQGLATQDINLSELSLVENVYSPVKDKLGLLGEDKNDPVGYTALNLGGNNSEVAFNLARWSGLSNEAAMSQSTDAAYENADGYYSDDYYYQLNEAQLVRYMKVSTSESTDTLKKLIMEYGIAVTAYYDDSTYSNNSTGAIYSTTHTGNTNHEIAIIGWDDDYAVTNFKSGSQPSQPGAWLVRNSWGTWIGESGYCWLSYEDTSLDSTMAFFTVCSSDTYDNNYQYDGTYSLSSSSAWHGAANIYTSQQNEYITAVNLSLLDYTDTDVTVRIYVDPSQDFLLNDTPATTQTFHNTYEGIYTVTLDNPVYVTEDTDFAVYYSFSSSPTGGTDSHSYDYSRTTSWSWLSMTEDTTNARSVTFNYSSCKTQDFTNGVWRIKAYTVNADVPATPDNFKVTLDGTNAVLTWDSVEGATAYEIYSGTDIGDYTLVSAVTENSATLPVTDANGIVIKYKVRAKIYDETGDFCNARAIRLASNTNVSALAIADEEIELGSTVKATPTFTPTTSTKTVNDIMVYYTVADSTIATVTPTGEITGVKAGTTTITGLSRNNAKTATATITVTETHTCVAGDPVKENEVAATCTAAGSYDSVTYCTICNKELSRTPVTTEKLAHTPGEAVTENTVPATCTQKGSYETVIYCTVCKNEISRTKTDTDMTAHTAGNEATENEVAATCTTGGSYDLVVRCTVCNAVISSQHITTEALGHNPGDDVTENEVTATCTSAGGYDTVTYCTRCNAELSRVHTTVDKLAHTPYISKEAVAATHTTAGSTEEISCSVCHQVLTESTVIPATTEHTEGDIVIENYVAPDCENSGGYDNVIYCTICGAELKRIHTTVGKVGHTITCTKGAKAATCIEDGWTDEYKCITCGKIAVESRVLPATGIHVAADSVRENETYSTCAVAGTYDTVVYCIVCKAEMSRTTTTKDLLAHTPCTSKAAVAATCTTAGSTAETACKVCGTVLTPATVISATGHTAGTPAKENVVAATCTTAGSYNLVTRCTVCNAVISSEAKTVEATGHKLTKVAAKAATCTEAGNNEYYTCSNCGKAFKDANGTTGTTAAAETINALGHDNVSYDAIPATCQATGCEAYTVCKRCGYSTYKETAKIAHNYVNGVCTMCGAAEPDASETCTHLCHQSGFMGFIWKIVNLFNKLFKINQYCSCGKAHW